MLNESVDERNRKRKAKTFEGGGCHSRLRLAKSKGGPSSKRRYKEIEE